MARIPTADEKQRSEHLSTEEMAQLRATHHAALSNVTALSYNEDLHEIYTGNADGMIFVWSNQPVPSADSNPSQRQEQSQTGHNDGNINGNDMEISNSRTHQTDPSFDHDGDSDLILLSPPDTQHKTHD